MEATATRQEPCFAWLLACMALLCMASHMRRSCLGSGLSLSGALVWWGKNHAQKAVWTQFQRESSSAWNSAVSRIDSS